MFRVLYDEQIILNLFKSVLVDFLNLIYVACYYNMLHKGTQRRKEVAQRIL